VSGPAVDDAPQPPRFLLLFRRVTTSGGFIPEIDGLRFIAIISVVIFHLAVGLAIKSPQHFAKPEHSAVATMAWNGFRGVELFSSSAASSWDCPSRRTRCAARLPST
jgi:hypothetical protein